MKIHRKQLGIYGEQTVIDYLKKQQFSILATNFYVHGGEIDIIAQHKQIIAFVEVKTRKNPLVDPAEVITRAKQKKIILAAQVFLNQYKYDHDAYVCRFDVALVNAADNTIAYIEDAFQESF